MEPLSVATWSFTASDVLAVNGQRIIAGLELAQRAGARVLLTPECALTGYPSAARSDASSIEWDALERWHTILDDESRRRDLTLVLGSCAREATGITNQAVVCGNVPLQRYRKRCLTPIDQRHFRAGESPLVVSVAGWRLGFAICFDLRFPDIFLSLAERGADAFMVIAHMAGPDADPGTKLRLIPSLCAVRAAETATPLVLANTLAPDRYLDSGAWEARGSPLEAAPVYHHDAELRCFALKPRSHFDPGYSALHQAALVRWRSVGR